MNEDIIKLKQENERLSRMAEIDWLTGLYNRGTSEQKINQLLEKTSMGILFVIDVNHFKQVNDRYGHIAGDHLLQEIARILGFMVLRKDILGRIGGDEFVVYMPVERDKHFAEDRSRQIKERLADIPLADAKTKLSVSIGWAVFQEGDDYQTLFDRADQRLLKEKRARDRKSSGDFKAVNNGIDMDIKRIRAELSEHDLIQGAYCQDYDTFKSIYRFVERRMQRVQSSAYIILFTLTDDEGAFPSLRERECQMMILSEKIQDNLRATDVYTQYTSGQFLVMVSDVTADLAEMIAKRIQGAFYRDFDEKKEHILLHHCYPLTPVEPIMRIRNTEI